MGVTIIERRIEDVVVFDVVGRLLVEDGGSSQLAERVSTALERGDRAFIFNLESVPYADTTGIADLVRLLTDIEERGGMLLLVAVQPLLMRWLEECGLLSVFTTFTDEVEAMTEIRGRQGRTG